LGRQAGNGGSEKKIAGRKAVAVVHIDGRVPEEVVKALRKIPAIEQAKAIRLF
jgi:hypothetical protein